jgi:hypothetical protein
MIKAYNKRYKVCHRTLMTDFELPWVALNASLNAPRSNPVSLRSDTAVLCKSRGTPLEGGTRFCCDPLSAGCDAVGLHPHAWYNSRTCMKLWVRWNRGSAARK